MYTLLRSLLFSMPPERAHEFATSNLQTLLRIPGVAALLGKMWKVEDERLTKEVFGLKFPNPVGLAAGFDKNAEFVDEMAALGFGFVEIGTVTPVPQPGNPKPRLFRLSKDKALINRMGFNNQGVDVAVERLKHRKSHIIVGGNIGKNKTTPNERAVEDYEVCFKRLFPYVDYFVVNVSSPNTPGLRELQEKGPLLNILNRLMELNRHQNIQRPILLKIAPDLTNSQLNDIIDIVQQSGIQGIIATNTTISREGLQTGRQKVESIGAGGLSGRPLNKRSTEVIRYITQKSKIPVIGVGGILSADDALEKLDAGASLVQLYTGFIYEGPGLVKAINKKLLSRTIA